jgi:hypothetical protein
MVVKFRDPLFLTRGLQFTLMILFIVGCDSIVSDFFQLNFLSDIHQSQNLGQNLSRGWIQSTADSNDARQRLVAQIWLVLYIINVIVFSVWIIRASKNVRALGASGLEFSPGWAVGWYFVPLACFFKPFEAMREIWKASKNPKQWRSLETGSVVGWWWFAFLAGGVTGYISSALQLGAHDLGSLTSSTEFSIFASFCVLASIVAALFLVTDVTGARRKNAKSIDNQLKAF